MNKDEINVTTLQVVGRVLEETAYLFTDEIEESAIPDITNWEAEGVKLHFTEHNGTRLGAVHLWVTKGFATLAASNMLGVEEDDPLASQKGMDALREILNVILGNLLTEVYGEEPVFDINLPTDLATESISDDFDAEYSVWLEAEDNPVYFVFKPEA